MSEDVEALDVAILMCSALVAAILTRRAPLGMTEPGALPMALPMADGACHLQSGLGSICMHLSCACELMPLDRLGRLLLRLTYGAGHGAGGQQTSPPPDVHGA